MNKILRLNNLKTRTIMNAKTSVFVICVKAITYLLLSDLHDCNFKHIDQEEANNEHSKLTRNSKQRIIGPS